jgi:hypothetical protein
VNSGAPDPARRIYGLQIFRSTWLLVVPLLFIGRASWWPLLHVIIVPIVGYLCLWFTRRYRQMLALREPTQGT